MTQQQAPVLRLYTPHSGQLPIHQCDARFRVVACGRRFGKTLMACNEISKFAATHKNAVCAWVAPTYRQSKIAYRLILKALHPIVRYKSDSELRVEISTGSSIMFCSSDNYDALRGNGIHFLVLDECADIAEKAWTEVLRPTLSDTQGKAVFIGTPKGRNFFYRLFNRGLSPEYPDWQSFTAPTSANPYIAPSEIVSAQHELPEDTFAQEYLAVFLEESAGVFRRITECISGELDEDYEPEEGHMYELGWDPAKYNDYSVLTLMDAHSKRVVGWQRFNQIDYTFQLEQVRRVAERFDAHILMDMTGVGDPLLEQLKAKGLRADGYLLTNASKKALIESLQLGLQHRDLTFPDIPVMVDELRKFEYHLSAARNLIYEAPQGEHDDCVISLALAYYSASTPRIPLANEPPRTGIPPVPTIEEIALYDPFAWADAKGDRA